MNKLKELRLKLGLTQEELAPLINRSYSRTSQLEQNYNGAFDRWRDREEYLGKLERMIKKTKSN